MIPALFEMDTMYRVFNFIAVRVMIDEYIRRVMSPIPGFIETGMKVAMHELFSPIRKPIRDTAKIKYVSELAKQFTIGIERKQP